MDFREEKFDEIKQFRKIRKNIGSIITTNYDKLIEEIFEFKELIGNNILLSTPYGSVYKIHGCVEASDKIILDEKDYARFDERYELIRAQLLSLFIHNPIIFFGYNVGDDNIKKILKTIFTYVPSNTELAQKIKDNFLLVEYEPDSNNLVISDHDIDMHGFPTIRINKIKTDDYGAIYSALSDLTLPVSALDVRKVQAVVKDIYTGGNIRVSITEDLDSLNNEDKVIAIGSKKTIQYTYQTVSEIISKYFMIMEESNSQILTLIDKQTIQRQQYFPIFGFDKVNPNLKSSNKLKSQLIEKINKLKASMVKKKKIKFSTPQEIVESDKIPISYKVDCMVFNTLNGNLNLKDVKKYLKAYEDKNNTNYKKMLCAYDYAKYGIDQDVAVAS